MPSLLLVVFAVEMVVQLVNTIGATSINSLIWRIVLLVSSFLSRHDVDYRKKRKEYLAVRRELNSTSSQDEFAKWAKLRRQHDRLLNDLEKHKKSMDLARTKFDTYLSTARLVSTRGLQWFLPFWYSREPMFWLPYGWFPYYVEWFASFPRAPIGSVSIIVWQWACTITLTMLMETVVAVIGMVRGTAAWQGQGVPDHNKAPGQKKADI